jgi:hypothetical protein
VGATDALWQFGLDTSDDVTDARQHTAFARLAHGTDSRQVEIGGQCRTEKSVVFRRVSLAPNGWHVRRGSAGMLDLSNASLCVVPVLRDSHGR